MIVSDLLKDQQGIRHGFFTRQGGVSEGIYDSLNCGYGSNDATENVTENRQQVSVKLSVEPDQLLTVHQFHSNEAVTAEQPWKRDEAPRADAIVTARRGLAVGILTADCTPILFADAEAGVVGAAHAGWRGAKGGIIEATLQAMERLGAQRRHTQVAIGPTISRAAYEVGQDFMQSFLADSDANSRFFTTPSESGRPHFDLPGYCHQLLQEAGVERIDPLQLCTYENESLFFSYRRSVHRGEGDYGRQISAIVVM